MTPPQRCRYYILPKNDPVRALNILRQAAGLNPLSDGEEAQPGVSEDRSSDGS